MGFGHYFVNLIKLGKLSFFFDNFGGDAEKKALSSLHDTIDETMTNA
jgi:hypothetical protein